MDKIIEFTNEKGNVKVSTRTALRTDMLEQLHKVLNGYEGHVKNVNGGFSIPLATDTRSGETVWAHVELTVNMRDPNIDSYSGRRIVKNEVVVPNLFGEN